MGMFDEACCFWCILMLKQYKLFHYFLEVNFTTTKF